MTKHTIARSARGSDCFLWLAGVPSLRDSTPAYALTSLRDSEFRRLHLPDNCRFVGDWLIMPMHHLLRRPANLKQTQIFCVREGMRKPLSRWGKRLCEGIVQSLYSREKAMLRPAVTMDTMLMSLIRMFRDGPEVSLKGSPTVSPTTEASCTAVCLPQ